MKARRVSVAEAKNGVERLAAGRRSEARREALDLWRSLVPILDYDARAAEWHARQCAALLASGRTEQVFDGQIAAIAATRELTLVTANTKHFVHYDELTLEDWSR